MKKAALQFILVVENGLLNRKTVAEELNREGYYVRFAQDAEAALKILIEMRPLLIMMGLVMPRLDSYTFTRIIKNDESTSDIRVIAISKEQPDMDRIKKSGFDGLVYIRDSKQSFVQEIRKILMNVNK